MKIMSEVMNLTIMNAILSDALSIYRTYDSVEVIWYMKIMSEVMNLNMNAFLSNALCLWHLL